MSKLSYYGTVKAHIPRGGSKGKGSYIRIGTAFMDQAGRMVLKLEAVPLAYVNWNGWVNIFPADSAEASPDRGL